MTPSKFPQSNGSAGDGQAQYLTVPLFYEEGLEGRITTLWRADWRERWKFLFTGELWLQQLTFGKQIQPQKPSVDTPFVNTIEPATIGSDDKSATDSG